MKQRQLSIGIKLALLTAVFTSLVSGILVSLLYFARPTFFSNLPDSILSFLLIVTVSLVIGGFVGWICLQFVERPLRKTIALTRAGKRHDYLHRIPVHSNDLIGQLAKNCNKLMERNTTLDAFKLETERELIAAQQEIKYKSALEKKHRQLTLLYDLSRALSGFLDSNDLYHDILGTVGCMLDYNELVLMLHDAESKTLKVVATHGLQNSEDLMDMEFSVSEGITGEAILKKKLTYVPNTSKNSHYLYYKGRRPEDVAFLSVPLLGPAGDEVIGILNLSRPISEPFQTQERETVQAVSHLISLAIANARLYKQVKELSIRDPLTHLFNRRYGQETIEREVKRAARYNRQLSLVIIDIDHFKNFNDQYGHPNGDTVLEEFASLLRASVRDVDYVVRWGGEEFIILLPNTDWDGSQKVAEKIRRNVQKHSFSKWNASANHHFTVSSGFSVFPDSAEDAESLIVSADNALYQAKGDGRNRVVSAPIKIASRRVG